GAHAVAFALAASVIALALTAFPLAVWIGLAFQCEIPRCVIYALLGYLWIWIFLCLLPVWLVAGCYEYDFLRTVLGYGLPVLVLSSPEWMMARGHRAAPAAGGLTAHAAPKEGAP